MNEEDLQEARKVAEQFYNELSSYNLSEDEDIVDTLCRIRHMCIDTNEVYLQSKLISKATGLKLLGSGCERAVYDLGNNMVLKVSMTEGEIDCKQFDIERFRYQELKDKEYIATIYEFSEDKESLIMEKLESIFTYKQGTLKRLDQIRAQIDDYIKELEDLGYRCEDARSFEQWGYDQNGQLKLLDLGALLEKDSISW